MKSLQFCIAAALLALLGVGCSSSSNTPAASSGSALDACKAYCTKAGPKCADAGTSTGFTSAEECTTQECVAAMGTAPAACQSSTAAWYNCLAKSSDVCDMVTQCTTELTKMSTDCK